MAPFSQTVRGLPHFSEGPRLSGLWVFVSVLLLSEILVLVLVLLSTTVVKDYDKLLSNELFLKLRSFLLDRRCLSSSLYPEDSKSGSFRISASTSTSRMRERER